MNETKTEETKKETKAPGVLKNFGQWIRKNQSIIKKIALSIGGFLIAGIGLVYILVTDLYLKNTANWLFLSIFTAFGSSACVFLSESIKQKPIIYYIIKGLGIVFVIAFVIIVLQYVSATNANIEEIIKLTQKQTVQIQLTLNKIATACLFVGVASIIFQIINITMNIVFGIDD